MRHEPLAWDASRITALLQALEGLPDRVARTLAQELMQLVLELHGAGLERILELIAEGDPGKKLSYRLTADKTVQALLLLHGLHPSSLEERVCRAIGTGLQGQGIRVELQSVEDDLVRLRWRASGNGWSAASVRHAIEEAILEAAPDAAGIEIEGLADAATVARAHNMAREIRIPVTSIQRRANQNTIAQNTTAQNTMAAE